MSTWKYRWAPSLGALENTPEKVWGIEKYVPELLLHQSAPVVFFGLYGLPDFIALWRHKGRRAILWAGSDITHFKNGYWLDKDGEIRLDNQAMAKWIDLYCESYVENGVEKDALSELGIKSSVIPSFLGKIDDYKVEYIHSDTPEVYTSVSGDNFTLYGWPKVSILAIQNPDIIFHLYGNTKPYQAQSKNVIVHGRVPKEKMNEEIKYMQGAIRLTEFDGFSEILAKSILWGQYPISLIKYPFINGPEQLQLLKSNKEPNLAGREHYRKNLNNFPWNELKK